MLNVKVVAKAGSRKDATQNRYAQNEREIIWKGFFSKKKSDLDKGQLVERSYRTDSDAPIYRRYLGYKS